MGELWKALSEAEKKKYNDMAEKDKERYLREKDAIPTGEKKQGKVVKKSSSKKALTLENTKKGKGKQTDSDDEDSE